MLSTFQNVLLIFGCILVTLAFLLLLQLFWPSAKRRDHNDVIGWHLSILGTTYAVIIGFMLYAVWTSFQDAEVNADHEANSLVSLYRLADGLPSPQRVQVRQLVRDYTKEVIEDEWPAMNKGQISNGGHNIVQQMWTELMQVKPVTFAEQTSMNLTLTELSNMTQHRRERELQSQSSLPGILWAVLLLGGGITTLSSCLFGTANFKLHCVQVFSLTLLLSLALVAIADIDRPFQGEVHVSPHGFERARVTIDEAPNRP